MTNVYDWRIVSYAARNSDNEVRKAKAILSSYRNVIVAFSGGLDSSFLLYAAVDIIPQREHPSLPSVSHLHWHDPSMKQRRFAAERPAGESLDQDRNERAQDPSYIRNSSDRCFFCKSDCSKG